MNLIVGFKPGAPTIPMPRSCAALPKHLPGAPHRVKNMQGRSVIAANHLYNVSPKDGPRSRDRGSVALEPMFAARRRSSTPEVTWSAAQRRARRLLRLDTSGFTRAQELLTGSWCSARRALEPRFSMALNAVLAPR